MSEIRNLTRNGETFYPLTHEKAVIGMEDFKDTITEQIENYRPIEITGDVTNAPDEEDITSDSNNLLKFKNRNNLYGLGKVILRRGSSFASQVTQSNTIYVIQYNFDLGGARINIPNGAILLFEGGSLSNGTLVCADLYDVRLVYYQDISIILNNVNLEGNFIYKACDKDTTGSISVDNSSIEMNASNQLTVKANGIQNTHLNGNVVDQVSLVLDSNNKISLKDGGVTNSKLDSGIVDNSSIALDTNNKISIKDGGVTGSKLNSGIVNTDDLSIVNNKIQLADRGTTNGMGKIILRKDQSFASQLTQQNTIYVIRYDFTLTSDVTIPTNCVLEFEGGSISGGQITITNNTKIFNGKFVCGNNKNAINVIGDNCYISGLYITKDNTNSFYGINIEPTAKNTLIENCEGYNITYSFIMNNGENSIIKSCTAYNCGWDCISNYTNSKNAIIENCKAEQCGRHGFSIDENATNISFINCTAINIGKILGEGKSSFHLEGAINSRIVNCTALYDGNHYAVSTSIDNSLIGLRIEKGSGNEVDGLTIHYKEDFIEYGNELNVYPVFTNDFSNTYVTIRGLNFVNDSIPRECYLGSGKIFLKDFCIKGGISFLQYSYAGIIDMSNGVVETNDETKSFYYAKYIAKDVSIDHIYIKNSKALIEGRLVDVKITDCIFEDCSTSCILTQEYNNVNNKSINTTIDNCIFKNLTNGVELGWSSNVDNNLISNCYFLGTFTTIYKGVGCSVGLMNNNLNNATYTNLKVSVTEDRFSGSTNKRPSGVLETGFAYFDTTLGKPIYWNGTSWVDATGTPV